MEKTPRSKLERIIMNNFERGKDLNKYKLSIPSPIENISLSDSKNSLQLIFPNSSYISISMKKSTT